MPKLFGRRSSHFTRLVRVVAHELAFEYEFVSIKKLMSLDTIDYGGHPGLKLPTLVLDGHPVFGVINICQAIAKLRRAADSVEFPFSGDQSRHSNNFDELVFQAMSTQVTAVLIKEVSGLDAQDRFAKKVIVSLAGTIRWLEENLGVLERAKSTGRLRLSEVGLFCLVEHIRFRETLDIDEYSRLRSFAGSFGERESAILTAYGFD